jgi:hypothetical protein
LGKRKLFSRKTVNTDTENREKTGNFPDRLSRSRKPRSLSLPGKVPPQRRFEHLADRDLLPDVGLDLLLPRFRRRRLLGLVLVGLVGLLVLVVILVAGRLTLESI